MEQGAKVKLVYITSANYNNTVSKDPATVYYIFDTGRIAVGDVMFYPDAEANVQPDWDDTDTSSDAYIKNKPTSVSIESTEGAVNYTPSGTISDIIFTGQQLNASGRFTPSGSITVGQGSPNYTPSGSVTVTPSVTASKTVVKSTSNVGTLPELRAEVTSGDPDGLTLSWNAGSLPTVEDVDVATDIESATASATFSGNGTQLVFSGAEDDISVSGTPSGSIATPVFNGTGTRLVGTIE